MKLLLHTCCAPCSVYCIDTLRQEGIEPVVYWFNPNIHPYSEYQKRRDCLKEYTNRIEINAIFEENYGLTDFCKKVTNDLENRCKNYCYPVRLEQTAKYAKENGYDSFTTTLLVSPYQNHEMLIKIGKEMAKKYAVEFLYRDFRKGFRQGQQKAKELGLYRQKYCGCIFSEEISKLEQRKKDKEIVIRENRNTERRIRLSDTIPNLDFRPLKRNSKEEISFIYELKKEQYNKYREKNKQEWNKNTQDKIFERYLKENGKTIKIITQKEEKIGFFDGYFLEDGSFKMNNLFLLQEYKGKRIDAIILKEISIENANCQ